VNRGEVWWLELPEGRRPVCILTRQAAVDVLSSVVVVPATRTIRDIPTELPLTKGHGMPADCVLAFDNIATVPKALLLKRITTVPESKLAGLCAALRAATGC
jgi:mRNA interferase MazF